MLEISNVKVYDLRESVIASRNPFRTEQVEYTDEEFDKSLPRAIQLANTPNGSGHSNWLKGVRVSFDIKYPNYISPELQRYNFVDIVSSTSKMHRLMEMDLDMCCNKYVTQSNIIDMREHIAKYKAIKEDKHGDVYFWQMRDGEHCLTTNKEDSLYFAFMRVISNCPLGIELIMRCSTNYLQLRTIYFQRKNHKLKEDWVDGFCKDFIENLPYAKEFIIGKNGETDKVQEKG